MEKIPRNRRPAKIVGKGKNCKGVGDEDPMKVGLPAEKGKTEKERAP